MAPIARLRRLSFARAYVRPWALATPVVVLLLCLPLLRPLRHPDDISDDELARLATVQAIVERRSLAIDASSFAPRSNVIRVGSSLYSDQPPVMALLLSGPYWALGRAGVSFATNPSLVAYLLTVLGVTMPVALVAGLVYRLSRQFELPRHVRAPLSAAVVFGSGLVSYGVVLNAHAPAAALLLCAVACLVHVAASARPAVSGGWVVVAGFCAALAATLEPAALLLAILILPVPLVMRLPVRLRFGGVLLYLIGAAPPLLLHAVLTVPVTGDLLPGMFHPELAIAGTTVAVASTAGVPDIEADLDTSGALAIGISKVLGVLVGRHGLFSHFPFVIVGVLEVFAVMHRHWPRSTKMLAAASLAGAGGLVIAYALMTPAYTGSMFAARWFVVFLPMLTYWAGAWLRRRHHAVAWSLAGAALAFSMAASLIGATGPFPREGFHRYTVAEALHRLLATPDAVEHSQALAGR